MSHHEYILGTRGSALALTQSRIAAETVTALYTEHQAHHGTAEAAEVVDFTLRTVKTEGDVLTGPLATLGGTGVFAAALRQRLLDGESASEENRVDMAVHSLKDLPSAPCPGLVVAATLKREDPRDALVARDGLTVDTLPEGSRVGTGSPRRAAQLRALRPDLEIVDIRGNVGTRIGRVKGLEEHAGKQVVLRQNTETSERADHGVGTERSGDCDAVVLAVSGLKRLGKEELITEYLDPTRMLPAPGQGALALEVRESEFENPDPAVLADPETARPVRALGRALIAANHHETRLAVSAERALLRRLEAGCAAPIGAYAQVVEGDLVLSVVVASPDGTDMLRHTSATAELDVPGAERLGVRVAEDLLQMGAAALAGLDLK